MKKFKVFAVAAVAMILGLTSCNKDNAGEPAGNGTKAYINLSFSGSETRAAGDAADAQDSELKDVSIFILAGNTVINQYYVTTPTTTNTKDLATTSNATGVFVVANAGNITNAATLTDLAKLKAIVANIDANPLTPGAAASQVATRVMMTSESVVSLGSFTSGGTPVALRASADVGLKFVGAKLIIKFEQATGGIGNMTGWAFKTYVNRVNGAIPFFGTAVERSVVGATLYSGIATTGTIMATYLADAATVNSPNHYYVFGNDATGATNATVVGIEATHPNSATPRYFSAHLTLADLGETIVPGNVYVVTLKLKGNFNDPIDPTITPPGVTDPNEETNPAVVDLTIDPAVWNTRIVLDKEI